jgi:hypothetical protein
LGATEIAKNMPQLQYLYLSLNPIGDDGAVVLSSNLKNLVELGLGKKCLMQSNATLINVESML